MAGGARLGFTHHQGGAYGWNYKYRYGPSEHHVGFVYLPFGWAGPDIPTLEELAAYPVLYVHRGGTWYNPGLDAMTVEAGSFIETIAKLISNTFYGVVITHDYRMGGYILPRAEDMERVYFPDQAEDGARSIQFVRSIDFLATVPGADRPLTKDPELSACAGASSGTQRIWTEMLQPDGAFPYHTRRASDDPYEVTASHICNPLFLNIAHSTYSGFSKGGPGYSWYDTYGASTGGKFSWAGPLFGNGDDFDWDANMDIRVRADFGAFCTDDNPRAKEVGCYWASPHISGFTPAGAIVNDPTGTDPASFVARYWRFNGGPPAPMETIRPVVDNVQAIATGPTGTTSIFRAGASWVTAGYLVGDLIVAQGFGGTTNHHYIVNSFANGNLDLVVDDAAGNVVDTPAALGRTIAGGGCYDLHGEEHAYIGHHHLTLVGNTRGRLRAGGTGNTNPDANTGFDKATEADAQGWLETEFGWEPMNA